MVMEVALCLSLLFHLGEGIRDFWYSSDSRAFFSCKPESAFEFYSGGEPVTVPGNRKIFPPNPSGEQQQTGSRTYPLLRGQFTAELWGRRM
ncbi:hypothetical protein CCACVL1_19724 [Corchorus capsularis]|uniref:Uncharacterized protein n=1 Tax=Corchorus capsularis TaxID=210143 RepID=A0A1R3HF62_COCAP|nr:hypothetical protein CCACVL1_19724 [Corchorus capsularis]